MRNTGADRGLPFRSQAPAGVFMTGEASGPTRSLCFRALAQIVRPFIPQAARANQSINNITSDHPVAEVAALGACYEEYFGPL